MPWGYKYTIHVYIEGEREFGEAIRVADHVGELLPHAKIGIQVEDIDDEPYEQVAT